jgi:hypothetical protein
LNNPWIAANIKLLAQREARWVRAAQGKTLVHACLRADNCVGKNAPANPGVTHLVFSNWGIE